MADQVEKNIAQAFAAESRAAARNEAFALKADQDGYPGVARLFRAVSNAGAVHARRFLGHMRGKIGSTEENLLSALEEEIKAHETDYPPMADAARKAPWAVRKAFMQTLETAGQQAHLFRRALAAMPAGGTVTYHVCQICGHISENGIPENCPVCHAVKGRFMEVK